MNGYRSRLKKNNSYGYIRSLPSGTYSGVNMFEGTVYNGEIYFIRYKSKSCTGYHNSATQAQKTINLYKWDGVKKNPEFVNQYTISTPIATYVESLGSGANFQGTFGCSGLIVFNNALYLIGVGESGPNGNEQYLYQLLPTFAKITDSSDSYSGPTFPFNNDYLYNANYYGNGDLFNSVKYVVFDNKIHVFRTVNMDVANAIHSGDSDVNNWGDIQCQHYAFDGNTWTKFTSYNNTFFSKYGNPVVWNDHIYILADKYAIEKKYDNTLNPITYTDYWHEACGIKIIRLDNKVWNSFYEKLQTSEDVAPISHTYQQREGHLYYKDKDGNYGSYLRTIKNPGGLCVLNDTLYLFGHGGKMFRYDENESEFILENDEYPHESILAPADVIENTSDYGYYNSNDYQYVTLVPFNGYIYSFGGQYIDSEGNELIGNQVCRYNPVTKEWND